MEAQRTTHPTAEDLKAFGLGKLDDRSSGELMAHLDLCADCRQIVAAQTGDDFLNHLRQAHGRSATPAPPRSLADAAPRPQHPLKPTTLFNLPPELADNPQYEIIKELGHGGMGVVYLAKNKLMDRLEVLKVINKALLDRPGALERFLREIRAAAKLSHLNVVAAYSALQLGELLVFAMEYVEGQDLAAVVKTNGPLPVPHACFYVQQAAQGLQHALEKKMVHRDIKPQNLILAREGRKHLVKILDFGLAKVVSEKADETGLTGEGNMLGTPDYMAPEQTRDAASADIRADIYSLGCTLYFLLTGQRPFKGKNLFEIMQAHQSREAMALNVARPEVPADLAAVVRKMMAKDRGQRYQTPLQVVQALGPFVKQPAQQPSSQSSSALSAATPPTTSAKSMPPRNEAAGNWASLTESAPSSANPSTSKIGRKRRSPAVKRSARKIGWIVGGAAVGLVLLGLLGLWASGVFKVKTKYGTLVLENLPAGAVVEVDGETVKLTAGDGKPITIRVTAGRKHRLQVKKEGFNVFGQDVEIDAGERRPIRVRLEAQPVPGKTSPTAETADKGYVSLFNGKDLTGWVHRDGKPAAWRVFDGVLEVVPGRGDIMTSENYGPDFQLHAEFNAPLYADRRGQGRGNSGIFLLGMYEIQILDSFNNPQPPERACAALYGKIGPSRNVCKPPNEWQTYDITFRSPRFDADKKVIQPGELTVVHNGVIVIDKGKFDSPSGGALPLNGRTTGPILLQDHNSAVRFRNLRIKPLDAAPTSKLEEKAAFVPLFNGKDLTGWKTHPNATGDWKVEKGILIGRGPKVSHLYSERGDYGNFHLLVEAKINQGGNSGVLFHKAFTPDWKQGYEAQIDSSSHKFKTGTLYVNAAPGIGIEKVLVPVDTWFTQEVIVQGNHIIIKINGDKTADFVDMDKTWPAGHIALQVFDKPTVVQLRRIEIKELPP